MSGEEVSGDDTIPVERPEPGRDEQMIVGSGADPLIASPPVSTGLTGEIERPGDHSPTWLVPMMFVGFALFIMGLIYVAQNRPDDVGIVGDAERVPQTSLSPDVAVVESLTDDNAPTGSPARSAGAVPEPGFVVADGETFEIVAQCEVHAPFAPVNTGYQVSSYAYIDGGGLARVVDRVFDGDSELATYRIGEFDFVGIDALGDSGAFAATFRDNDTLDDVEVAVSPAVDSGSNCSDRVVINEPGQFSEPQTLVVLDICVDRTASGLVVAGITSQGSRFDVAQSNAEVIDIAFRPGSLGATTLRSDSPGESFIDENILSVSGVVTDGVETFDISVDVGAALSISSAEACINGDRL
jgi:hypothetical protein